MWRTTISKSLNLNGQRVIQSLHPDPGGRSTICNQSRSRRCASSASSSASSAYTAYLKAPNQAGSAPSSHPGPAKGTAPPPPGGGGAGPKPPSSRKGGYSWTTVIAGTVVVGTLPVVALGIKANRDPEFREWFAQKLPLGLGTVWRTATTPPKGPPQDVVSPTLPVPKAVPAPPPPPSPAPDVSTGAEFPPIRGFSDVTQLPVDQEDSTAEEPMLMVVEGEVSVAAPPVLIGADAGSEEPGPDTSETLAFVNDTAPEVKHDAGAATEPRSGADSEVVPAAEATTAVQVADAAQSEAPSGAAEESTKRRAPDLTVGLDKELEDMARLQTLRIYEALRLQKADDADELARALAKQAADHQAALDRTVEQLNVELARKLDEQRDHLRSEHEEELEGALQRQKAKLQKETAREVSRVKTEAERQRAAELLRQSLAQAAAIEELAANVDAIDQVLTEEMERKSKMHAEQRLCLATASVATALDVQQPIGDQLTVIRASSPPDADVKELVDAVLDSVPSAAATAGVLSLPALKDKFKGVSKAGRAAAMVPPDGGLWAHLVASAITALKIPEKGLVEGATADAVFSRAEHYLATGDVTNAVRELETLTGEARDAVDDWITAARNRSIVQQALDVVHAQAALSSSTSA